MAKCPYCCNHGHLLGECPHMAEHLLNPSPQFNGLRSFVQVIDTACEKVGFEGPGQSAVKQLDTGDTNG